MNGLDSPSNISKSKTLGTQGMELIVSQVANDPLLIGLLTFIKTQLPDVKACTLPELVTIAKLGVLNLAYELIFVAVALARFIGEPFKDKRPPLAKRFRTWEVFWRELGYLCGVSGRTLQNWYKTGLNIVHLLDYRCIPQKVLFSEKAILTLYQKAALLTPGRMLKIPNEVLIQNFLVLDIPGFKAFAGPFKIVKKPRKQRTKAPVRSRELLVLPPQFRNLVDAFIILKERFRYCYIVPVFRDEDAINIRGNLYIRLEGCEAALKSDFGPSRVDLVDFKTLPKTIGALRDALVAFLSDLTFGELKICVAIYRLFTEGGELWYPSGLSFKEFCDQEALVKEGTVSYRLAVGEQYIRHSDKIHEAWSQSKVCFSKIRHLGMAFENHADEESFIWSNFAFLNDRQFALFAESSTDDWFVHKAKIDEENRLKATEAVLKCLEVTPKAPHYIPFGFPYEMSPDSIRALTYPVPGMPTMKIPNVIRLPDRPR